MVKQSRSTKPKKPLAVIVMGAWDDRLPWAEGVPLLWKWSPEMMAELQQRFANDFKARGYQVRVLSQPTVTQLRRVLARDDVRATAFVGHGQTHGAHTSFWLNNSKHIAPDDLRTWYFEDKVKPQLSPHHQGAVAAGESEGDIYRMHLEGASSYNFEYSALHFCESMKTLDWSRVLGGETQGHKKTQRAHVMPRSKVDLTGLVVNPDFYADDPNRAIRSALVRDLAANLRALSGSTGPILSAPGRFETLRAALVQWIELESRYGRRAHLHLKQLNIVIEFVGGAVKRPITLARAEGFLAYYNHALKEGIVPSKPGPQPGQGATSCNGYNHPSDCRCGFGGPK